MHAKHQNRRPHGTDSRKPRPPASWRASAQNTARASGAGASSAHDDPTDDGLDSDLQLSGTPSPFRRRQVLSNHHRFAEQESDPSTTPQEGLQDADTAELLTLLKSSEEDLPPSQFQFSTERATQSSVDDSQLTVDWDSIRTHLSAFRNAQTPTDPLQRPSSNDDDDDDLPNDTCPKQGIFVFLPLPLTFSSYKNRSRLSSDITTIPTAGSLSSAHSHLQVGKGSASGGQDPIVHTLNTDPPKKHVEDTLSYDTVDSLLNISNIPLQSAKTSQKSVTPNSFIAAKSSAVVPDNHHTHESIDHWLDDILG
ncbi:hypothetical protein BASA50_006744 [Batrachochytrium salamandrivorans]|uniref:Uncharacterized protein n=1 Tax=Batrachochytrium salamandrivorans TaxID=1357716 RepID=A0ABQ8F8Y9_9FUNG|nr:hypothetical protein BASA60_006915 [Batrachochytrium salamandrivorans]KAH6576460.1 hypothetical protein BASA62_001381 [Batrachochytrium salamandrivorans]KAH6590500.1 hypothetical protein BASA61_005259 [Batrachochytrium salamandrivorans]KAH6594273.1 hypothetical protein BASA50_006744 [Batrachochytrium salamandrivorans]KAH9270046.1 hypothetical protein BASA83_007875 [Batrachochytrium salamandrivorans]